MRQLAILIGFAITACTPQPVSETGVGEVVKVRTVPTSFNESLKTNVETTKGTFTVKGVVSAIKGSKATMTKFSDGRVYLCIAGVSRCKLILGL